MTKITPIQSRKTNKCNKLPKQNAKVNENNAVIFFYEF